MNYTISDFYNTYKEISEIPKHVYEEMRHFFKVYKELEHKETAVNEVGSRAEAEKIIESILKKWTAIIMYQIG